tara:strand:+ start:1394 stop:1870 length:477 start_codon:yes stop_codon:yes gene_type:complete
MAGQITIRKALLQDSIDLFKWRNDPLALEMSKNSSKILKRDHDLWLKKNISKKRVLILICENSFTKNKIGIIRFDFNRSFIKSTISINISPEERGKKYSKVCLKQGITYMKSIYPQCREIIADVKKTNLRSIDIFTSNEFEYVEEENFFNRYKLIYER